MKNAAPKTTNARLTPMSDQERLDANNARKHAQKLRRIERAKEMIARGLPAEEIAEELGYRLATYERFCRDNRLVPLKTPGAKRKAANG